MRGPHFAGSTLRLRAKRRAIAPWGASQAGQEHNGAIEHNPLWGMGPSLAVEGATTARVFETYLKKVLAPSLKEKDRWCSWTNSERIDPEEGKGAHRS